MKRYQIILIVLVLIVTASTVIGAPADGSASSGPALVRQRFVSVGMQPETQGSITLRGTFGQPNLDTSTDGAVTVCTGFWCGWPFLYEIMLPVMLR